jgi:glycosyltransferase involved in cell wall biosynthesis
MVRIGLDGTAVQTLVIGFQKRQKFDVIHDHSPYGLIGTRNTGVKVIRTVYGDQNILLRTTLRDDVLTVFTSRAFAEFYGYPRNPVVFNPPVWEFDPKYYNTGKSEPWVAYVGNLATFKGTHIALEWAKMMGRAIGVFGPAKDSSEYIHRLRSQSPYPEVGVGRALELLKAGGPGPVFGGMANEEQKWTVLSRAHALFVPSVCVDNAPTIALEAMLAGCPILGHNVGGIPEILGREGGLATYDLEEIRHFDQWIEKHYHPELAHNRVLEVYNVERCVEAYEKLYQA